MSEPFQILFDDEIFHSTGDVRIAEEEAFEKILRHFGIVSECDSFAVTLSFPKGSPFDAGIDGYFEEVDEEGGSLGLREFLDLRVDVVDIAPHTSAEQKDAEGPQRVSKGKGRGEAASSDKTQRRKSKKKKVFSAEASHYHSVMGQTRIEKFEKEAQADEQSRQFRDFWTFDHFSTGVVTKSQSIKFGLTVHTDSAALSNWLDAIAVETSVDGHDNASVPRFNCCQVAASVEFSDNKNFAEMGVLKAQFALLMRIRIAEIPTGDFRGKPEFWEGWLALKLETIDELDFHHGCIAIDFGNHSSAVCVASEFERDAHALRTSRIEPSLRQHRDDELGQNLMFAGLDNQEPTLDSAVLIERFVPYASEVEEPDRIEKYECKAGKNALIDQNLKGLVVGPKRWVGTNRAHERLQIAIDNLVKDKGINSELPAELLLTALLKELYYENGRRPGSLAITYPSTYSSVELGRLERIILRSLDRSLGYSLYQSEDLPMPLFLDEATAAAFFFLYRDFFYSSGRIEAFAYLYPNGANVCVADFGGGTTDIGLVHCRAEKVAGRDNGGANDDQTTPSWIVHIHVLGRTGERTFGGDNITIAVFKYLKARIANEIAGNKLATIFEHKESFTDNYDAHASAIDGFVPTRFKYRDVRSSQSKRARELTRALWVYAEDVKKWIAAHVSKEQDSTYADEQHVVKVGERPAKDGAKPFPEMPGDLVTALRACSQQNIDIVKINHSIGTAIVDELDLVHIQFQSALEQVIKNTNNMIRERLTDQLSAEESAKRTEMKFHVLPEDSHVDRLYVVGNAAQYPLVRNVIGENFNLPIVNHHYKTSKEPDWDRADPHLGRIVFDKKNLKSSVVKGALLAKHVTDNFKEVYFAWDEELRRRLPYDVCMDSQAHDPKVIYSEGEHYDVMMEKPRRLADPTNDEKQRRTIVLDRKWPGEPEPSTDDVRGGWKPFLKFSFDEPLEGPLYLRYVENDDFIGYVIDDARKQSQQGVPIVKQDDLSDLPPMQRGDL